MGTLSNMSDTSYEIPLSEADQIALRPVLLHDLGAMPFESGALISRSLWVIFIGEWGVWTHAVLPVDDRLDMPDRKSITGLCDLVGSLMRPSVCHDDEKAMIVLRRPGPAEISAADACIFRVVCQAAIGRETAPWTFHVVGPDGIREVPEHEGPQDTANSIVFMPQRGRTARPSLKKIRQGVSLSLAPRVALSSSVTPVSVISWLLNRQDDRVCRW